MSMVTNLLSVTAELKLDHEKPKGELKMEVEVLMDDGLRESHSVGMWFEGELEPGNGRPPPFRI